MQDHSQKQAHNFTVAVKIRPNFQKDRADPKMEYRLLNPQTLVVEYSQQPYSTKNKKFVFDSIFVNSNNRQIYDLLIKPSLPALKDNRNLTILTYGITGSGKTYTIFGNARKETSSCQEEGVAMMAFEQVMQSKRSYNSFCLSYLQIYNEQINDLLNTDLESEEFKLKSLNILEDAQGKVNIPEMAKFPVQSLSDIRALIERGNHFRSTSSNHINHISSRSHALLQLYCKNQMTKVENILTIIDLAGSERLLSAGKENLILQKEGSNINRSLLALGNCIKSLENGESHIPYRDSKLTRILKDELSGRSHNIMIACVGTNYSQAEQTLNTLQYASRATKIKVEIMRNEVGHSFECEKCLHSQPWKQVIKRMPQEIEKKSSEANKDKSWHSLQNEMKFIQIFDEFRHQILSQIEVQTEAENANCLSNRSFPHLFSASKNGGNHLASYVNNIFQHYENRIASCFMPESNFSRKVKENKTPETAERSITINTASQFCDDSREVRNRSLLRKKILLKDAIKAGGSISTDSHSDKMQRTQRMKPDEEDSGRKGLSSKEAIISKLINVRFKQPRQLSNDQDVEVSCFQLDI